MRKRSLALLIALCFGLSGCATIVNGNSQEVFIASNPAKAEARIGKMKVITPSTVTLKRGKRYPVVFMKEGYEPAYAEIRSTISLWFLGNLGIIPPIGMIPDILTGAMWNLKPKEIIVTLKKREKEPAEAAPAKEGSAEAKQSESNEETAQ